MLRFPVMGGAVVRGRRRGRGEGSIYKDEAKGRWYAAVSVGYGPDGKTWRRHKVSGRTRGEVAAKLRELQAEQDTGAQPVHGYTVRQAVEDWLAEGLDGRSAGTVTLNRYALKPVIAAIGDIELRKLTAHDVRSVLTQLANSRSSRTVVITHNALARVIRHAEANDYVRRNVAGLVRPPRGQPGRPSKSLTLAQASLLLAAAEGARLGAYVVLCLLAGVRTEEARALTWDHISLDGDPAAEPPVPPHVAVWRSVRAHGDTKTEKSRRTLRLPTRAVEELRAHRIRQAEQRLSAGALWRDHRLVFCTSAGTPLDAGNVRRTFKKITRAAGLGEDWTPRELRTSFVSLMSDSGVPVEEIARLVGHSSSRTTEVLYRRELRLVITTGAEVMDNIFSG